MHGLKMKERAFRRMALAPLGIDTQVQRASSADVRSLTEAANLDLLPPDLTMPITQLDSGRPVFVVGIDSPDSDAWIL